jgi:hypothetical protein
MGSPGAPSRAGGSILRQVAPMSASRMSAAGPGRLRARLTTRVPQSTPSGAGRGARAVVMARMCGNGGGGGQRRRLRGAPYPCGNGRGVPARRSHHRLPRSQSRTGSHPGNWARLPWYPIRWRREDRRTCGAHAVRPSCLRPGAYRRPGIRARAMATKSGRVPSHGRTRRPTHGHAWRAGLVRRQPALSVARRWRVGCGTPAGCCGRAG